jgi:hypothetical protein
VTLVGVIDRQRVLENRFQLVRHAQGYKQLAGRSASRARRRAIAASRVPGQATDVRMYTGGSHSFTISSILRRGGSGRTGQARPGASVRAVCGPAEAGHYTEVRGGRSDRAEPRHGGCRMKVQCDHPQRL